jgi:hypothetical protein
MAETVFRGIIEFMEELGVYEVILPFILVFTIVYAILEKTRVLGVDVHKKVEYSRRNLNSMVAFVMGFLVVASRELVSLINETMANIVVLLLVAISWLMLVGTFYTSKEPFDVSKYKWAIFFQIFMFIGVVFIFLHAIPGPGNHASFLEWFLRFISLNWNTNWVGSLILIIFVVLFMYYVTQNPNEGIESGGNEKS